MKLKATLFVTAFIFQASAWGENITKVAVGNINVNTTGLVDESSTTYCLSAPEWSPSCFKQTGFRSLILRENGRWGETARQNAYLSALKPASLAFLQQYPDFTLRSVSVDKTGMHFMAFIEFKYGPDEQTNLVFGDISHGAGGPIATVTAYADINPDQESRRFSIKTFENSVYRTRNFQSVITQVRVEDMERAQAVQPLIELSLHNSNSEGGVMASASNILH